MSIREFQFETLENPTNPIKKKILFIDKPLRQRVYTKRELNEKYFQRSFRSLLLSTTGGKRDTTDDLFHSINFNDKIDYSLTEIRSKIEKLNDANINMNTDDKNNDNEKREEQEEEEDEDDETGMIISTGEIFFSF